MTLDPPPDLPSDERDPPNALPRGTLLNDKFRVQRVIGVGGFGIVYLAHDEMSEVDVAIKEYMPASLAGRTKTMQVSLTSQSNAETFALGLKSFWNEARLLAKFRDEPLPLLKVYDAFQANGTAYMVMPVLRGRTAHQLRREMPKPPSERWLRKLLVELLPALERLHAENVYHRDIAPDNIQVDIHGKPVLMDLGAARHVIGNRTQSITAILKPGYAPIEQYGENEKLRQGPWTDIYALGATLHFMLLSQPPANATARLFDVGKPLVEHDLPGCSPPFLRLIDWMLAPRPEDRPQSVAQLKAALNESDAATRIVAPGVAAAAATSAAAAARVSAPAQARSPPQSQSPSKSPPPATLMSETTVIAPPAPRSLPPANRESVPPPLSTPSAAAEPVAVAPARTGGSLLPKIVAGVAALVVVVGSAAWLWPRQPAPGTTAARPSAASQPEALKAAPAIAFPRPEPAEPLATQPAPPPTATTTTTAPPTIAAPAPVAAPLPPPAPAVAPKTPTASTTTSPDGPAAQTAAVVPSKRASAPALTAPPVKKPVQLNDKDGALLPKPPEPAPQAIAVPPTAPSPPPSPAPAPVAATPPEPAAATVASPSERCSDKSGIARRLCIGVVCGLPALHNHPECVAIRRN